MVPGPSQAASGWLAAGRSGRVAGSDPMPTTTFRQIWLGWLVFVARRILFGFRGRKPAIREAQLGMFLEQRK